MKYITSILILVVCVVASSAVYAGKPRGSAYIDGDDSKTALILAHGRGKYPKWKVVNPLRKKVNKKLGMHTLSLQMPNDDKNWKQYADDFPNAYVTIKEGIRYLREEKGVTKIFLFGHSMGSRMVGAFVSENPE
jgi:pimeloyl-ACP methyl ester carboxylesterase